jgi:hypothetical protein
VALSGGPHFQFSGAVPFVVNCETQEEIDYFWETLSAEGEKGRCGWIAHHPSERHIGKLCECENDRIASRNRRES